MHRINLTRQMPLGTFLSSLKPRQKERERPRAISDQHHKAKYDFGKNQDMKWANLELQDMKWANLELHSQLRPPPIIPILLANPYLTFIVARIQKTGREGSGHWAGKKEGREEQKSTPVINRV